MEAAVRRTAPRKTDNTAKAPKPKQSTNFDRNGTDVDGPGGELQVNYHDSCSSVDGDDTDDDVELAPGNGEGGRHKRRRVPSTRQREATESQTGVMSPDSNVICLRDKGPRQSDPSEAKRTTAADAPGAKRARAASSVTAYVERHYADLGIPWMVPPERSPSPLGGVEPDPAGSTGCEGGDGTRLERSGAALFGDTGGGAPTFVRETTMDLARSRIDDGRKESGAKTAVEKEEEGGIGQKSSHPVRNSSLADVLAGRLAVGHGGTGLVGRGGGVGGGGGGVIGALHTPKRGGHRHMYLHEQQHHQLQQTQQHENRKQFQQHQQSKGQERTCYGTTLSQLSPSTLGYVAPAPLHSSRDPFSISSAESPIPQHSSVPTYNPIPLSARMNEVASSNSATGAEHGGREEHPARRAILESDTGETRLYRAPVASTIVAEATTSWNSQEHMPTASGGTSAPPTVGSETNMVNVETGATPSSGAL